MKVKCPACGFEGNIKDELIPEEGKNLNCPKCKKTFFIEKTKPEPKTWAELVEQKEERKSKKTKSKDNKRKYEYKIEFVKESFLFSRHQLEKTEGLINKFADEGWELDKITIGVSGGFLTKREAMILVFRRST